MKISRAASATICLLVTYLTLVAFGAVLHCSRDKARRGESPDAAAAVSQP